MRKVEIQILRSRSAVLLSAFCLLYIAAFSNIAVAQINPAQINRNSVTGFVFDARRSPIENVPVEITNEVNQVLARTRTNGSGKFFFSGLSAGRFTVRVTPYGTDFLEQSQDLEIINFVRAGSNTSEQAQARDFYLQLRRDSQSYKALTGAVYVQEVPKAAEAHYLKALSHFENNAADRAMQELLDAVKIFPEYYAALERLGREYIKNQKFDFAYAAFLKAVSVNDRSFSGWYGLSYAAYAMKNSGVAIEAAQKAVTLGPASADAFLMLGIAQRQAKKYTDAEKALLQAKKLANPSVADVHWNLALLYGNNLNKYAAAADELELFLKAAPGGTNVPEVRKLIARFREKPQTVKFTQ